MVKPRFITRLLAYTAAFALAIATASATGPAPGQFNSDNLFWGANPVPIANGGTGQGSAKGSRAAAGLNIDSVTTFTNANYAATVNDRVIATTATNFTAARTVTLLAVSAYNPGQVTVVVDSGGAVNGANTLIVAAAGGDTINGASSVTINAQYSGGVFYPIGANKWGYIQASSAGIVTAVSAGTGMNFSTITSSGPVSIDKATAANVYAGTANKVLTADNALTPEVPITFSATQALDFSTFRKGAITLTGNITSLTCSNMAADQVGQIRFIQDATGSRTMASTWCTQFIWQGGVKGTLSTAPGSNDILIYYCYSATVCEASLGKSWS